MQVDTNAKLSHYLNLEMEKCETIVTKRDPNKKTTNLMHHLPIQHWYKFGERKSHCPFCLFRGISYMHLSKHIVDIHGSTCGEIRTPSTKKMISSQKNTENIKEKYMCFFCDIELRNSKARKNHINRVHKNKKKGRMNSVIVVTDILNKILEKTIAPEYEELCDIKIEKKEEMCVDENLIEPELSAVTQKSPEVELEIFQGNVFSAVMSAMNLFYSAKYQEEPLKSCQGTFLQIAGEMINRLCKEIKDSYVVLHGGLKDIRLTPDNQMFIRNQVERYLSQDLQNKRTPAFI